MHNRLPFLISFVLLLIGNLAFAQTDTIVWNPSKRLKLSDFSVAESRADNYIDVFLHYEYRLIPAGWGKYIPLVKADAILNRKTSSLNKSSNYSLRYAQLLFDISGYQTRLMELKAFELGNLKDPFELAKSTLDSIFFATNEETAQLKKDLDHELRSSSPETVLLAWEQKIANLIRNTPEIIQEDGVGAWQLGIFVGVSRSLFTGKTKEYFTDATGVNFGFDVDVKRSRFVLDGSLDFNKTKNALESKGSWSQGMKTHFASIELSYGVKFTKNKWVTVPYAGFAINEFTPAKTDKDDKRRLSGYSPVLGLEVNYNFRTKHDSYEKVLFFYKVRASVNPSNFIRNYGGTQINLKLAVGFDTSLVRKKLVKKI